MQTETTILASNKFDELSNSLNFIVDDLKIACAEASLEGDIPQVNKLVLSLKQIDEFIFDIDGLSKRWKKGIFHPSNKKKLTTKKEKYILLKNLVLNYLWQ
ncbi:MAG: hypothetical protein HFP77_02940 [Methylococcales symbiont of Iophon sp. n. MRB-2018]|nr:MAG: hypothetical protein HFP77_02940 [Methylococcales symbiont of Iophon sp. n. MRB-2018]KAF3980052.1 MAG: hypothetical protein HFP76_03955 [Methylococcales symbiont of Iophon sp. n. MRB-2018]